MNRLDMIIKDKDDLYNLISLYTKKYQVITLKANMPGEIKNNNNSKILLSIFKNKILKFKPVDVIYQKGNIQDSIIFLFSSKTNLKKEMIKLEEEKLGRFIDIDCYYFNESSEKRKRPRKCFLCDNEAFYCIRNKTHTNIELNEYIDEEVHKYIKEIIYEALDYSFMRELKLYPKFGLVSIYGRGSHKDMNYKLMIKSKNAIIPYLTDMFDIGYYNEIESIFKPIRVLGKIAEEKMLEVTNGVNTYKGLIFALGIVSASTGYYLKHLDTSNLEDVIKMISKDVVMDFEKENPITSGLIAYKDYKIMGARGNAINGYKIVFDLLENNKLKTKEDLYKALFYFVYNVDDTVLLKRAKSFAKYIEVKDMFKEYNKSLIIPLTKYSIKNNLSFGGSADLLSVSLFIQYAFVKLGIALRKE